MNLYMIRHAWAEPSSDQAWPDDRQRPLTPDGKKRFSRMIKKLVANGFSPTIIATSPLVRCRQTADLLAKQVPGKPSVIERSELAPGSDLDGILLWTGIVTAHHEIAWVGHAPDVGQMVAALIGRSTDSGQNSSAAIDLAKGAIAAIQFAEDAQVGQGTLRWLVTAKILGIDKES